MLAMQKILGWVLLAIALGLLACNKDDQFVTGSSVEIDFSTDTLRFDTVFTQLGSATRSFTVRNNGNRPVRIDKIALEGSSGVRFRLNVDGIPGNELTEIDVWAKDSIHIFVEVTIDPSQPTSISPYIVTDQISFFTGDVRRQVVLEAWGQNANYIPSRFNRGIPVLLSCNNQTVVWDSPLPYVIYGEILIDSCLLQIEAGSRLYFHGGIARNELFGIFNDGMLYTLPKGRIHINGSPERPVILQGDRLEEEFQEAPGQWFGLIFGRGSRDNRIEYATIKNSIIGMLVDSAAELRLRNTQVYNTAGSGLSASHASVNAENCLFRSNAGNSVQLTHGGDYAFDHCTIASYGVDASAAAMSNFKCYTDDCSVFDIHRINARWRNCIIFGSRNDEIILSDASQRNEPALFNLSMRNCVVRVRDLLTQNNGRYADFFSTYCVDCVNGPRDAKLFLNRTEQDYRLDSLSIAIDMGLSIPEIPADLLGNPRVGRPDAGCYERQ